MDLNRFGMDALRGLGGLAAGGILAVLTAGSAQALSYTSGDLVAVFISNSNEFVADLGQLTALESAGTSTFNLPVNGILGPSGALGGNVTGFQTMAPFSGTQRTIVFTTDPSVNPPANDNMFAAYVSKIPAAQGSLDTGATGGSPDWLQNLNNFPPVGTAGVLVNTSSLLAYAESNPSSYTNVLNKNGLNQINGTLPFSTASTLATTTSTQVVDVWQGSRTGLTTSTTSLIGTLAITGNALGNGNEVQVVFTAVPEPGTIVLLAAGLSGLIWAGRGRRTD